MKTILFYWSKGADVRVKLIRFIAECERKGRPCYNILIAKKMGLSHVAIKKHLDLLIEERYVSVANPKGKPHYLTLSGKGVDVLKEFGGR